MPMSQTESEENISRVENLIQLYEKLFTNKIGNESEQNDILRSAVVFLHSTVEELVRNLFIEKMPKQDRKTLDEIPFSVHIASHRSKGILLGELAHEYRGQFLDNIVLDSINAYVNSMNLNDITQLVYQLEKVKIDISGIKEIYPNLNSLMKRRHQIVHQMDRSNSLDPDTAPINSISVGEVKAWQVSTRKLIDHCLSQ